jgi:acyl-CoA synthetase (AMP-forming)/AMP-acid ligase II
MMRQNRLREQPALDLGGVDVGAGADDELFCSAETSSIAPLCSRSAWPAWMSPGVAEAYVLGLPHAMLGEQVAACVVRRPGAAVSDRELVQFCRAGLVAYKCPERIVFVDGVTKTSRGKVHRASLRSLFASPGR